MLSGSILPAAAFLKGTVASAGIQYGIKYGIELWIKNPLSGKNTTISFIRKNFLNR
jgi:hypothetical protein